MPMQPECQFHIYRSNWNEDNAYNRARPAYVGMRQRSADFDDYETPPGRRAITGYQAHDRHESVGRHIDVCIRV